MDPSGRTCDQKRMLCYQTYETFPTDLLTVGDIVVVIITVLRSISMKRCSDVSFTVIKYSEASLECFENLKEKNYPCVMSTLCHLLYLAEKATVVGG